MQKQKAAISPRRNPVHTSIVASSRPKTQSQKLERLNQAITRRELTESLEILAESQIEGDLAIFGISNLHDLLGRTV